MSKTPEAQKGTVKYLRYIRRPSISQPRHVESAVTLHQTSQSFGTHFLVGIYSQDSSKIEETDAGFTVC